MQRRCPDCLGDSPRTIASLDAAAIVRSNGTYRRDALSILDIAADTTFDVVSCSLCGFVYARESLDEDFLSRLYRRVIDPVPAQEAACSPAWVAHQIDLAAALLRRVENHGVVRFLDYGCGEGTIVRAIRGPRIHAMGYEPYMTPDGAVRSSLEEVQDATPFDALLLSDVLEHVPDPRSLLRQCRDLLAADGWMTVSVPLFGEARLQAILDDLRSGRAVTPELNPWEHLNYFSPESLVRMVESEGFRVEPVPVPNFGLRSDSRGIRRALNAARAAARMLRFAAAPAQGSTTVFAQRR